MALIFFASFLGYIAFNPGQAQFFITFGINPADIKVILQKLVNAIFGTITFLFSIVWIIYLFRAIRTKKELKKRKTTAIILSIFLAIVLFSTISLWAFINKKINASDFENPDGGIIVYDDDEANSPRFKDTSQMKDLGNLV